MITFATAVAHRSIAAVGLVESDSSGVAKGGGQGAQAPPMAGQKKIFKIDISDFEVSCGLSSPKSPDINTSLRLQYVRTSPVAATSGWYCTFLP